jgi:hypothetical protein
LASTFFRTTRFSSETTVASSFAARAKRAQAGQVSL